ncbi:invasion associated locus B family protein [Solirhodobacter olei]|uniref:invasion associated locus B family protein n=1 Tax=Solirhodobacter olei TaxID=2493082 RepID=UPI000FD970ED|nr:invasion associated locus B family protein [Solirhodobacter olei]
MLRKTKALPLILALALAPAAMAQTTSGQTSGKAPATTPDMGKPANGSASGAVGTPYVAGTSGDWSYRCVHAPNGHDPCQLYQLLKDSSKNPVAEIAITALPDGQPAAAAANIVTPLETLLPRGITLHIDGVQPKVYAFLYCTREGCVANVGFTKEEVDAMKKGKDIAMSIVPAQAPDQKVDLTVSLKGFTDGLAAVAKLNEEHGATPKAKAPGAATGAKMPSVPSIAPKK